MTITELEALEKIAMDRYTEALVVAEGARQAATSYRYSLARARLEDKLGPRWYLNSAEKPARVTIDFTDGPALCLLECLTRPRSDIMPHGLRPTQPQLRIRFLTKRGGKPFKDHAFVDADQIAFLTVAEDDEG